MFLIQNSLAKLKSKIIFIALLAGILAFTAFCASEDGGSDTTAPTVSSINVSGTTLSKVSDYHTGFNVSLSALPVITVTFNEALKTDVVPTFIIKTVGTRTGGNNALNFTSGSATTMKFGTSSNVVLNGSNRNETNVVYENSNTAVKFSLPWVRWHQDAQYNVRISGIQDAAGNAMAEYTFSFEVAAIPTSNATVNSYTNDAGANAININDTPAGQTAVATYNNNFMTINSTGVTRYYTTCLLGSTGNDCSGGTLTAISGQDAAWACSNLNAHNSNAGFGGRTGWRLLTDHELRAVHNTSGTLRTDTVFTDAGIPIRTLVKIWSSQIAAANAGRRTTYNNTSFATGIDGLTTSLYVLCISD